MSDDLATLQTLAAPLGLRVEAAPGPVYGVLRNEGEWLLYTGSFAVVHARLLGVKAAPPMSEHHWGYDRLGPLLVAQANENVALRAEIATLKAEAEVLRLQLEVSKLVHPDDDDA